MDRIPHLVERPGPLYVADNANGRILGYDRMDGSLIDYLDTGLGDGALMGITFDSMGSLYFVDTDRQQVIKVSPL